MAARGYKDVTVVDMMRGIERAHTFGNPFTSWHYRAMPRPAYMTDVDGVEVQGQYPVVVYEVKTINASLYRELTRERTEDGRTCGCPECTPYKNARRLFLDLWGRANLHQLETLNRLVQPGVMRGFLVFTPPSAEAFYMIDFKYVIDGLKPGGMIYAGLREDEISGRHLLRQTRRGFWPAKDCVDNLMSIRMELGLKWAERERDASGDED